MDPIRNIPLFDLTDKQQALLLALNDIFPLTLDGNFIVEKKTYAELPPNKRAIVMRAYTNPKLIESRDATLGATILQPTQDAFVFLNSKLHEIARENGEQPYSPDGPPSRY